MIKLVLGILFIAIFGLSGFYYYSKPRSVQILMSEKDLFLELVLSATPLVKAQWEEPDLSEKKNCPTEGPTKSEVGDAYYACNSNYWQCWHSKHPTYEIKFNEKIYHVRMIPSPRYGETISRVNLPGSVVKLGMKVTLQIEEIKNSQIDLVLEDTCRSTYLMQRSFPSGPDDQRGMIFDTFGKDYFIDKFVVTNRDIHEWVTSGNTPPNLLDIKNPEEWAAPAGHLNLEQQKLYCLFQGKKLMEAHLFDAASFYPGEVEVPMKGHEARSLFFWAPEEKKKLNSVTPESCQLLYVSDCVEEYKVAPYQGESYSDTGLYRPLGGVLEALINRKTPYYNLKASSTLFSYRDIVHNIGLRAHWSGDSTDRRQFDWKLNTGAIVHPKNEPLDHEVGFRCFFEREGEQ